MSIPLGFACLCDGQVLPAGNQMAAYLDRLIHSQSQYTFETWQGNDIVLCSLFACTCMRQMWFRFLLFGQWFPLIWPMCNVGKLQSNDHLWGFAYCLLIIHLGESVDLSPGDCPLRWAKWVHTHLSVCTAPKRFTIVFENSMAISFVYSGTWRTCWPKEACLYVGSDWLSSSSSQKVARGQLDNFFFFSIGKRLWF